MDNLSKALNTDMAGLAQILRKKGRGKDSVLAHITPKEAALLKARGGSGTTNPDTGLPEFDDGSDYSSIPDVASQQDPAVLSSGGDSLSPQQTAAANPNLYAQGQLPTENQSTNLATGQGTPYQIGATQDAADAAAAQNVGAVPAGQQITGGTVGQGTVYSPTGAQYSPAQLDQFAVGQTPTEPKTSPNLFETAYDKVSNYAASDKGSDTLTRMGLATALGLYGASTNRAAASDNRAATAETQAIAAPYQQQGQNLIAQAQAGALSPASQQAYAAAQAQLAQAQSGRGGVGAQQTANQMATLYQTLLNNQYTYGLQVAQIGDNIAVGAIQKGLAMDQQLNQSTQNFYTNLAGIVAGVPPGYRQVASTTPTTPTGG